MAQTDRTAGLVGNTAIKAPCRVATTASITLSGEQTIDGVSVVTGDRVLVKDQSPSADKGIYVADTGDWTRALDFDGVRDVVTGTLVYVNSGTVGGDSWWKLSTTGTITIGTTSLTFQRTDTEITDAELAALAGLTSAADRLPYFTGSGTASLATFTSVGRNLVNKATVGDVRSNIGAQQDIIDTRGQVLRGSSSGAVETLALGTALKVLGSDGTDMGYIWQNLVQVQYDTLTSTFSTTKTAFASDSNITGLEVSLTPKSASHRVMLIAFINIGHSTTGNQYLRFYRDNSTAILVGDAASNRTQVTAVYTSVGAGPMRAISMMASDLPGGTSAYTFNVHIITNTGTAYVNRSGTDTDSSTFGRGASSLIAIEYIP